MGRNIVKSLGMGPGQKTIQKTILKFARPILKRVPFVGAILDFALSVALGEDPGRAAFGAIGAGLLGAIGTFLGGPVGTLIGGFAGDIAGRKLYDLFFGGKGATVESEGMNRGGTVSGKDVGDKDSVPTYLTVGEKVIPRKESSAFAPFLDDIIYNGGNLYKNMSLSFELQNKNNELFLETNKKFSEFLDRYNQLERENKKITFGGGGGSSSSLKKSSPSISSTSKSTPSLTTKKGRRSKGDNMIVAPAMGSKKTETSSAMSSSAQGGDSVPILSAEDPDNFFVPFMKEQLGIFGA